jgi:hypothetical protein
MNFTPPELPELSRKERALYSCVIVLWYVVILATSLAVGLIVAFACGIIIGYYHVPRSGGATLISSIAFASTGASWLMYDHSSKFMQRHALAVVERRRRRSA